MKGFRTLDWRFWVALSACLMVAYLVVGGYQDNVAKGHRIDNLIAQAQAADAQQAAADMAASQERQDLLDNQDRLLRLYRHQVRRQEILAHRLDGLLAYLQAHGIAVPSEFRTGSSPARRKNPGERGPGGHSNATPGKSPGKSGGHAHPKSPGAATTAPAPDLLSDVLDLLTKGTP